MASPPYTNNHSSATSPLYQNSQLPPAPKRRQSEMSLSTSNKRRKPSNMAATSASALHPLRQTSFPPGELGSYNEMFRGTRSPSVDNMSLVSGSAAGGTKKKRAGKKTKGAANDDESTVGGAKSAMSDGKGKRRTSREPTADEDEDEGGDELGLETAQRSNEEKRKETENRELLVKQFDKDQFERYALWRSVKFGDATTRRIVNQTLSQSVPAAVIFAIRSVTKEFAGELIEGARKVQDQWLEATGESQVPPDYIQPTAPAPPVTEDAQPVALTEKEKRRGPLTPDHLRESLRRYKAANSGGLAGQLNLWQLQQSSGVERFASKVQGKRLFK